MPRRKDEDKIPNTAAAANDEDDNGGARPFWSGTIAFGLVSLPVNLYTANRARAISLRMLDQDGTPLSRRFFCSRDEEPLAGDDLVRGFEIEKEHFIEVDDEELQALAPEKSREIDLRRFVPRDQIDPMYFERGYFLIPDEGASKAYRLLAQSMESMGRAGIATFIMRGKEYLIAIIAEGGLLRAETLRFHDELRRPTDVGLSELSAAAERDVKVLLQTIDRMTEDELPREQLVDEQSRQLLALVERKLEAGEDVLHAPELPEFDEGAEVIDLMEVLKRSLEGRDSEEKNETQTPKARTGKAAGRGAQKSAADQRNAEDVTATELDEDSSKSELYDLAKELDIHGRSHMNKQELIRAIQQAR